MTAGPRIWFATPKPRKDKHVRTFSRRTASLAALGAAAFLAAAPVAQAQDGDEWVDITTWNADYLYEEGWSADELLDEEVYGANGEIIGEVEDFIIGPEGRILRVVVEGGGFLDIGDSHVAVPWNEVERSGVASITVPLIEENLGQYRVYEEVDDERPAAANWRLRHLIGDNLVLDEVNYGYVRDVIFGANDRIEAVIASPAYGYGYPRGRYAFPYRDAMYDPYGPSYLTPYTTVEVEQLRPFDYRRLD